MPFLATRSASTVVIRKRYATQNVPTASSLARQNTKACMPIWSVYEDLTHSEVRIRRKPFKLND